MTQNQNLGPIFTSIALVVVTCLLAWQIMALQMTNQEQEKKIQELFERVANWEQLVGPHMQNLTALIKQVDDKMATIIENDNASFQ